MLDPNPFVAACSSRQIIAAIGDKWSLLIIPLLIDGPRQNAELMRAIDGISQKMLTQTLKNLEDYNLIARHDYGVVPPRVDYRLTDLGQSLASVISTLDSWVIDNFQPMMADPAGA